MSNDAPFDQSGLIRHINNDSSLSAEEKQVLLHAVANDKAKIASSGISNVLAKFNKLSKPAQVLLVVAGFSIGKALLSKLDRPEKDKSLRYNKNTKSYDTKP